ncbi:hypothetical protein B0H13DRAFT_1896266 [Mycena leptocephala]|nr:hypothetical protein B0H13DRAFT_1896266 [Mycena leptocephala]
MGSDKGCPQSAILDCADHQRSATEPAHLQTEDEQTGWPARAIKTNLDTFSLSDSGASSYRSAMTHPSIRGSASSDCLEHLPHLELSRTTTSAFHVFSRPPSPPVLNEDSASSLVFHPVASDGSRSSSATEGPTTPIWSWETQRKFHQMSLIANFSLRGSPVATSSRCFAADALYRKIPRSRQGFERKIPSVVGNAHSVEQASGFRNPSSIFPNPPSNMSLLCCPNTNSFNDTSSEFPTTVISPLDVTMGTITSLGSASLDASMFGTPQSLELRPEHEAHLRDMESLDIGLECIRFES